jgi:hypothetical protein
MSQIELIPIFAIFFLVIFIVCVAPEFLRAKRIERKIRERYEGELGCCDFGDSGYENSGPDSCVGGMQGGCGSSSRERATRVSEKKDNEARK